MLFLGQIRGSRQDGETGYIRVTSISLVFSEHVLTQPTALGFITSGFIPVGQENRRSGGGGAAGLDLRIFVYVHR